MNMSRIKMGGEFLGDADVEEVLSSMLPDDLENKARNQFNIEKLGADRDMLEDVTIIEKPLIVDFKRLLELTNYSEKGSSQLAYLRENWEYKQANAARLLNEELDILSRQSQEAKQKKLEILEANQSEEEKYTDKCTISTLDEMLKASIQREHMLMQKLQDTIKSLDSQLSPIEELSQVLKRADNFLHFVLQNAPVIIGHQDVIGKTDTEVFSGAGVKELHEFKKEVMERGLPAKREITFETELFGVKTYVIYVEPVFSKTGDTIGVNYMGMDITDQVIKREKIANLLEEIAVQKAKETELNKTIHVTEEMTRAKQMLATIRSPLSGIISMAKALADARIDKEQHELLDGMLASGDLVLQLISDMLDLSKDESDINTDSPVQ